MRLLKYKTDIKCAGCKEKVAPFLEELHGIFEWDIDANSPDKILTVKAEDLLNDSLIITSVKEAGFKIEALYIEPVPKGK